MTTPIPPKKPGLIKREKDVSEAAKEANDAEFSSDSGYVANGQRYATKEKLRKALAALARQRALLKNN